jgi:hypothetical protein
MSVSPIMYRYFKKLFVVVSAPSCIYGIIITRHRCIIEYIYLRQQEKQVMIQREKVLLLSQIYILYNTAMLSDNNSVYTAGCTDHKDCKKLTCFYKKSNVIYLATKPMIDLLLFLSSQGRSQNIMLETRVVQLVLPCLRPRHPRTGGGGGS